MTRHREPSRFRVPFFLGVFCFLVVLGCLCGHCSAQLKPPTVRVLRPEKYFEVIDLILDAAKFACETLGELIDDETFNYQLRCDLFYEKVEDLSGMCDGMVKEIKLTQKQMVENAIDGRYDRDLVGLMKTACKDILSNRSTTEDAVGLALTRGMSQWILDVSVHEKGKKRKSSNFGAGGGAGFDATILTLAQREKLREMGLKLPSEEDIASGKAGDDQLTVVATDEDREWAREVSAGLKHQKKRRKVGRGAPREPHYDL